MLPDPSNRSSNSANLAHNLAVSITCHAVRDRRSEADAFLEVKTCIKLIGAKPFEEDAVDILTNEKMWELGHQLTRCFNWEPAVMSEWVSTPRGAFCCS